MIEEFYYDKIQNFTRFLITKTFSYLTKSGTYVDSIHYTEDLVTQYSFDKEIINCLFKMQYIYTNHFYFVWRQTSTIIFLVAFYIYILTFRLIIITVSVDNN